MSFSLLCASESTVLASLVDKASYNKTAALSDGPCAPRASVIPSKCTRHNPAASLPRDQALCSTRIATGEPCWPSRFAMRCAASRSRQIAACRGNPPCTQADYRLQGLLQPASCRLHPDGLKGQINRDNAAIHQAEYVVASMATERARFSGTLDEAALLEQQKCAGSHKASAGW